MTIPQFPGLGAVIERYDALILDLWGVVHNGIEPYPDVPECLEALGRAGKRICLLTNAPRRPAGVERRLVEMGIDERRYQHVMTSGEATHEALRERDHPWIAKLGPRFYFMGPERDHDTYLGLDAYTRVGTPDEADFILCCGIIDYAETLEDQKPALSRGLARGLPLLCANPDLVALVGENLVMCAGTMAQWYADQGGDTLLFGKPHSAIYERCLRLLGISDKSRVLGVGDGIRTDIKGAVDFGIDSAFVVGGIHAEEVGSPAWGEPADPDKLEAFARSFGVRPTMAIPRLVF